MREAEQLITEHIRKEFLADKPAQPLDGDTPLIQQGIIDSLGVFLLIGFLEERFGVKIEEEDVVLENFATVKAIVRLVDRRTAAPKN
jgi:acyl carrier protein